MHVVPAPQAFAQAPQFFGSDASLTQVPPQRESPAPQFAMHCPAVQTVAPVHALPQAPQLRLSVAVLVHALLQSVWLVPHAQLPEPQTSPVLHALPQAPQLAGSLFSLTQRPPHSVCALGQVLVHAPLTQASPAPHFVPQAPQFDASSLVFVQVEPQSV